MIEALSLFPFFFPVNDALGNWADPNPCPVEEMGFSSEELVDSSIGSLLMVGFADCDDDGEDESRQVMVNLGLLGR